MDRQISVARRRRKSSPYTVPSSNPMYGWALSSSGRPIPILMAERGGRDYICPICLDTMIAKKGNIKQHHFAHESQNDECTPEAVAEAIAGKWLVLALGTLLVLGEPCFVQWYMNGQDHQVNILEDVFAIAENKPTEYGTAEIALMQDIDTIRCIIMLNLEPLDKNNLAKFTANGIPVIVLPTDQFRSGQINLNSLFQLAEVYGGWWLEGQPDDVPDLVLDPEMIRRILIETVYHPPYKFWAPLTTMGVREHVVQVHNSLVWLPDNIWDVAVGGTHNRLSSELDIVMQEWRLDDESVVVLYYVKLNDDRALAIRRFMSGADVHASIDAKFRMLRATAEQVAYLLATS